MNLPNYQNCRIVIIGLGYVGLPLAIQFSNQRECLRKGSKLNFSVSGFDLSLERIKELKLGFDKTNEIDNKLLLDLISQRKLTLTSSLEGEENADFFIVTVPTPIDEFKKPDLNPLIKASCSIGEILKKRTTKIRPIIIFESTVFPGATEDICAKLIEEKSGFVFNEDFFCGYSPERINPGDDKHRLTSIRKVISGSDYRITRIIDELYGSIIQAGTYIASSIKVAEAAKVIENTQRDLNIALVNELAILFKKMNIDTLDILETAGTKWNFLPFRPGLVGGHCIGVDPYYLTHKAQELGFKPNVILAGRKTNDNMSKWISDEFLFECKRRNITLENMKILILGITFKENCPDFRNTKVIDIIDILKKNNPELTIVDPWVDKKEIFAKFKLKVLDSIPISIKFDSVICAVAHDEFQKIQEYKWVNMLNKKGFFFDIKGIIPRGLNPVRI